MNFQSKTTKLASFTIFCFVSVGATMAANGRIFEAPQTTAHQVIVSPVGKLQSVALAGPDRNPREIRRAPTAVERPELKRKPQAIEVSNDVLQSLDMHEEAVKPAAVETTTPPTEAGKPPTELTKAPKTPTGPDGRVIAGVGVGAAAVIAAILLNNSDDPQLEPPLSP